MEEDGQTTPFWLHNTTTTYFHPSDNRHRRGRTSSICLNSGVLIVLLSIVAAAVTIFFLIPSFLSFTSQVFRPNLVKKSWDSLTFVLVLFAIFCGILGRKKDDGEESNGDAAYVIQAPEEPSQPPPVQQEWFGYSGQRMKRNSSSYPDLRRESSWAVPDENWRFGGDDSYLSNQRLPSNHFHHSRHEQEGEAVQESGIKTIPVDTYVVHQQESSSPLPTASSARPPQPPSEMKHKARRTFHSVAKHEKTEIKEMEFSLSPILPQDPPPPPPPPEALKSRTEKMPRKIERKRSNGAKEIASTLASSLRKNKRRSEENFDDISPSPPPPPPPPPPPASKFHKLFKIGSKSKRIHSVFVSSPLPPPPPPPMSPLRPTKHKTQRQRATTQPSNDFSRPRKPTTPGKPPLASKLNSFYYENLNSGNQSPLAPMPPPPFKMPGIKFIVRDDYAKLQSNHSSQSTCPDVDSVDTPPIPTTNQSGEGEGEAGVSNFCPSPDVNTKAETFIARFRAGLRKEKVKSLEEKQEIDTSISNPNTS